MFCLALALVAAAKVAGALMFDDRVAVEKAAGPKAAGVERARASGANSVRMALPDVVIDRGRSWAPAPQGE